METKWKFYTTSIEAWDAMLSSISNAKHSIDLEQYIFSNDEIGSKFIDLFKLKASEGVKVRILCDTVGSFPIYRSSLQTELAIRGIELHFFNSIVPWSPHNESLWYFRNHRKLLVIDGQIGFTGGVCISLEMKSWRESHIRIEGPVVSEMSREFELMWYKQYRKPIYYLKSKKPVEVKSFSYLTNSPLPNKRFIYYELISQIKKAEHYVYLTTPYFLPDYRLIRALKKAVKRGVKIKILLPIFSDNILVRFGSASYFDLMLDAGVRIYRYKTMIHGKTMVVDGRWSSIGSLNLDNISLRYNFEANIVSTNKAFTFELEKQFIDDLVDSDELLLPIWRQRPWWRKYFEACAWLVRKLL